MIDRPTIDRIFATADIVEVISDFVKLKKTGANYKGHSPFTNEKTPSFFVSPAKGIFKCFSSGAGGNVVSFLMQLEKYSYPEALRYLAKKYNIEIQEEEMSPEKIQEKNTRESLLAVTDFASKQFTEWLFKRDEGRAVGLSYFKERGFREMTIEKFQLGYSLEQRDAFTKLAIEKGYKMEYLTKSGMSIDKGNYQFDRFAGRVLFPIHSLSGQVIGFGGRILKNDAKTAKYLNSPESEIYHKSHVLYGAYFAKGEIIKKDRCYMVEGYTDVISMHQAGIENVVSSSGTALTVEQIRLIKRFTKNITVLYDGDEAGIKASLRGIDLILEEGMNVKVLLLPEGEDPDSYARSHSSTEFVDFIHENESDFIKFKTKLLMKEAESDPVRRATLITDIVKSISVIPDNITRSVYMRECSKMLEIGENILYQEINKLRNKKTEGQGKRRNAPPPFPPPMFPPEVEQKAELKIDTGYKNEKELVRALLNFGNMPIRPAQDDNFTVAQYIAAEIENDEIEFQHPIYGLIYKEIVGMINRKEKVDTKVFTMHENQDVNREAVDLLTTNYDDMLSEIWKKKEVKYESEEMRLREIIPELVIAFKNSKVLNLIHEIEEEIAQAQKSEDYESIMLLQQKFMVLNELKKNISKDLGARVVIK